MRNTCFHCAISSYAAKYCLFFADYRKQLLLRMRCKLALFLFYRWELFSGGVRPYPHVQPDKIPRLVYKGERPTFNDDVPLQYRCALRLPCSSLAHRIARLHTCKPSS